MNGSFNHAPFPQAANEPQLELPLTPGAFFGSLLPQDMKILSGGEYLELFHKGMDAGFTDSEFKLFLKERGIEVRSSLPATEESPTVSIHTPDNGKH